MSKKTGYTQDDLLMRSLQLFYANPVNLNKMLPILSNEIHISLRLVDWFITNYSKSYKTTYTINDRTFNVHASYKAQLKAYSKKRFDPFCRDTRIKFYYTKTKCLNTTVGQLNFFKWAIINKILEYIIDHLNEIELDMKLALALKNGTTTVKSNCAKRDIKFNIKSNKEYSEIKPISRFTVTFK